MTHNKEITKVFNASLTESEIKDLERISTRILGQKNKSGLIRYWITQDNLKNCKSEGKK